LGKLLMEIREWWMAQVAMEDNLNEENHL
jgi:hypothetical protein